jgi:membrane carboxypeptidase/penicillin-binding protein PbpC
MMEDRPPTRSWLKWLFALLIVLGAGLAAREAYALWRAERQSAAILEGARAKAAQPPAVQLTPEQRAILLAVEDPGFETHSGVDFNTPGQELTTLPQALVKLLYFERFQPGLAKIEQTLIARFVLERHDGKEEQLKLFVAHARFGAGAGREVVGFADAALTHFGKPFDQLHRAEYISLVAMLIAPNEIRPDRPAALKDRSDRITAMLAGRCGPSGLMDTLYANCSGL